MDKILSTCEKIIPIKEDAKVAAQRRLDILTKPQGSLGKLEDLALRYASIKGMDNLLIKKKTIFTFAGDHGVADEGVSAFPKEVTAQMVLNFLGGGAAINVLARHNNIDVVVVDMGVDYDFGVKSGLLNKKIDRGTQNITKGPAMTKDQATDAINTGIDIANEYAQSGVDLIGTGDMGIANTTPSSAIFSVLCDLSPGDVTGRGTGIGDLKLEKKIGVIEKALKVNNPDPSDPVDILAKVGGFEICAITGLIIGAAAQGIPVVIDGFISSAGALAALNIKPAIADYIFVSHLSKEAGHKHFFFQVKQKPLLDLDMRLGEGTGSALAIGLIEASVKLLTEMATFEDAQVSESNK